MNRIVKLLSLLLIFGCTTPSTKIPQPPGFAAYEKPLAESRFVSPERVMIRLKTFDNEENGTLVFWKTALQTHLKDTGYILLEETEVKAKTTPGYAFETTAPSGGEDYTYLIALFVVKDKIMVIEAAGETKAFKKQKKKLLDTIANSELGN